MRERELDLRHDSRHQRSVLITIVAAAHSVGHLLAPWRRLQQTRWGAHTDEPDPSLADAPSASGNEPGDIEHKQR